MARPTFSTVTESPEWRFLTISFDTALCTKAPADQLGRKVNESNYAESAIDTCGTLVKRADWLMYYSNAHGANVANIQ